MDASDRFHGLHAAYKKAEDALHSLGIEAGGVDTAAVNELRYAGRHLLNGLVSDDPDDQAEQFLRSRRHCERALYEAYDSAIYYHFAQYDQFKADYRRIVISDVIPDFVSIEKTMKEARDFLDDARRDSDNREDYYRKAAEKHANVSEASKTLEAAREELNKKVNQHNEDVAKFERSRLETAQAQAAAETGRKQTIKITIIVAVVTAIINIAAGYWF